MGFHAKISPMANDLPQPPFRERNPITHQIHKREVFWQITIPVVIGAVIVLAIASMVILATATGSGNVSDWADASLILMILPTMLMVFILMLILAGPVYLITLSRKGMNYDGTYQCRAKLSHSSHQGLENKDSGHWVGARRAGGGYRGLSAGAECREKES